MYKFVKNTNTCPLEYNLRVVLVDPNILWRPIKDILDIKMGQTPTEKGIWSDITSGIPCLGIPEVMSDKVITYSSKTRYVKKDYNKRVITQLPCIYMTSRATIGDVAICNEISTFDRGLIAFTGFNLINIEYFRFCMIWLKNNIISITPVGGVFKSLTKDLINDFKIPYIQIQKQEEIANFLSNMENTIFKTEELIASMEKRLRYYVRELTSGRIRIKKDGEQIDLVENEHFKTVEVNGKDVEIPVDWDISSLKNSGITINTGKLDTNKASEFGQYPFFSCSINQKLFIDQYAFDGESLLVTGNGDPGVIKYYNGKFNAYQRTYVLQNGESMQYLKYCMIYNFKKHINSVGSVIKYIRIEDFNSYLFCKPKSLTEQEDIANLLVREEEDIEKMKKLLDMQKKRLKWAMSELLSGRYTLEKTE